MPEHNRDYPDKAHEPSRRPPAPAPRLSSPSQRAAAAKWYRDNAGPEEQAVEREARAAWYRTNGPGDPDNYEPLYDEYGQY